MKRNTLGRARTEKLIARRRETKIAREISIKKKKAEGREP
jgi:hypothetical protein